jgi:hypothetical protein
MARLRSMSPVLATLDFVINVFLNALRAFLVHLLDTCDHRDLWQ